VIFATEQHHVPSVLAAARYDDAGVGTIGVTTGDTLRRLCSISDFYSDLDHWRSAEPTGEVIPLDQVRRVPPVPQTAKVLCLGLNYAAHIAETGRERPDYPNVFARWYASLSNQ